MTITCDRYVRIIIVGATAITQSYLLPIFFTKAYRLRCDAVTTLFVMYLHLHFTSSRVASAIE